jgi:hypothetical protein
MQTINPSDRIHSRGPQCLVEGGKVYRRNERKDEGASALSAFGEPTIPRLRLCKTGFVQYGSHLQPRWTITLARKVSHHRNGQRAYIQPCRLFQHHHTHKDVDVARKPLALAQVHTNQEKSQKDGHGGPPLSSRWPPKLCLR